MRIISGKHKGKKLQTPPDARTTRPIPDRVKESVFNLLRGHYEGARVVDLFAGTGSIGLEAYSRGAARVLLVEKDKKIARVLGRNIEAMGNPEQIEVLVGDALGPGVLSRAPEPVTLLFADPPYPLVRDHDGWTRFRAQFMKLLDMMDPRGFAVIRPPWPFLHERRPAPTAGGGDKTTVIDLDEIDDDELDAIEREWMGATAGERFVDVDLTLDNAEGPETHAYGSTAVHLYMRKSAEDGAG